MLILGRRINQSLHLDLADGRRIVVTVNRVTGKRVTLGIEAAKDIEVRRAELERREPRA